MPYPTQQLRKLARLFNRPSINALHDSELDAELRSLCACFGLDTTRGPSLGEIFDELYAVLWKHHRSEYVYKNCLANALYSSPDVSAAGALRQTIWTEFQVGDARADVAVFDHRARAFEIKSEQDSTARLERQIECYRQVFPLIYLVTHPRLATRTERSLPPDVGVMVLSGEHEFTLLREAESNVGMLSLDRMFSCLRRSEYCTIIRAHFSEVPDVTNCFIWTECRKLFLKLDPLTAHAEFVSQISSRSRGAGYSDYLDGLPESLKFLGLTQPLAARRRRRILNSLAQPLS